LEDLAWASWAVEAGFTLAYVAEAEVVHVHEETPRQVFNRYRREAMALKTIQPDQRFGLWDLARLVSTNVVSDVWHASRVGKLRKELGGILRFRWLQFYGTYRGFAYRGGMTSNMKRNFYYPRGFRQGIREVKRSIAPIDYRGCLSIPTKNEPDEDVGQ